ncbi:MAG: 4-alpha-glucanotransferase [Micrococcus sp.]|nr:4-alpha-glucanotransferase [Micrococcus sp.]
MSTARAASLLLDLAEAHGIQPHYQDQNGEDRQVAAEVLVRILDALGVSVDPDDADALTTAVEAVESERWARPVDPTLTSWAGPHASVHLRLEEGAPAELAVQREGETTWEPLELPDNADEREAMVLERRDLDGRRLCRVRLSLPDDLAIGVHRLRVTTPAGDHVATLLHAPRRLTTADPFLAQRGWGVAVQLYSLTSRQSWGIGDLHDAGALASVAAAHGADFVLLNPLHAVDPAVTPLDSPYSPVSRRFVTTQAIRVSDIAEYAKLPAPRRDALDDAARRVQRAVEEGGPIDRAASAALQRSALREVFAVPRSPERAQQFEDFCRREGSELAAFAAWSARRCDRDTREEARFHQWCQWIAQEQLAAAQARARQAGMRLGLMVDLAVGADRLAADHALLGEQLVEDMSVGAPPDMYNQLGQDWSQHPWHPRVLAEQGYAGLRSMFAAVMRHAGGVRIDHVLGLFRLWWVPVSSGPQNGAYVRYDHDAMLATLLIEAHRWGTVVIGEDLGTFEPWVQQRLAEAGILGTDILWFDADEHGPVDPLSTRRLALAAVNTHDLPPTAGYLEGVHLDLRERLGLLTGDAAAERATHEATVESFRAAASVTAQDPMATQVTALHRFMAQRPAALHQVALVDAVGERRIQNQPGTTQDHYPNWTVPLGDADGRVVHVEDLAGMAEVGELFDAVHAEVSAPAPEILLISFHTHPAAQPGTGDAGGLNTVVAQSAAAYAERGIRAVVLTRSPDDAVHVKDWTALQRGGITPLLVELPAGALDASGTAALTDARHEFARASVQWFTQHRAARRAADGRPPRLLAVHGHYWLSGAAAQHLARASGVPWLQSFHTTAASKTAQDRDQQESTQRRGVEAEIATAVDALVVNTSTEAAEMQRVLGVDPRRTVISAPGVDHEVFTVEGPAVWPGRLAGEGLRVLYAGRLQRHKGAHVLIEAVGIIQRERPDLAARLELHLCGATSGAQDYDVDALIEQSGVGNRVSVSAPVPRHELAALYRGADVVAMPSFSETFGLVAAEAQACGTPVLAHRAGGLQHSVADGATGRLIAPNTAAAWARALSEVVEDTARDHSGQLADWAARAPEHARAFTWDAHVARILEALSPVGPSSP